MHWAQKLFVECLLHWKMVVRDSRVHRVHGNRGTKALFVLGGLMLVRVSIIISSFATYLVHSVGNFQSSRMWLFLNDGCNPQRRGGTPRWISIMDACSDAFLRTDLRKPTNRKTFARAQQTLRRWYCTKLLQAWITMSDRAFELRNRVGRYWLHHGLHLGYDAWLAWARPKIAKKRELLRIWQTSHLSRNFRHWLITHTYRMWCATNVGALTQRHGEKRLLRAFTIWEKYIEMKHTARTRIGAAMTAGSACYDRMAMRTTLRAWTVVVEYKRELRGRVRLLVAARSGQLIRLCFDALQHRAALVNRAMVYGNQHFLRLCGKLLGGWHTRTQRTRYICSIVLPRREQARVAEAFDRMKDHIQFCRLTQQALLLLAGNRLRLGWVNWVRLKIVLKHEQQVVVNMLLRREQRRAVRTFHSFRIVVKHILERRLTRVIALLDHASHLGIPGIRQRYDFASEAQHCHLV